MRTAGLARRAVALAVVVLVSAGAAFAQYPVTVYGGGYAGNCYRAVKDRNVLAVNALEICNIALRQEDLSSSNRAASFINRGILHMRGKDHDRARKDYEAALRISPDMPEAKINLGAMLYYTGRYADAVKALDDGVKVKDEEARAAAHFNRALAYERLGDLDSAYADYRTALEIRPGYEPAEKQIGRFAVVPAAAS